MIFCAIPMTENWPFFAYDDRKFAVLVLDGYRRQHFFFSRKPNFLALIKIKNIFFFDRVPQLPAYSENTIIIKKLPLTISICKVHFA
jgi:hypothetical protein